MSVATLVRGGRATCSDPKWLPVVDRAFGSGKGWATRMLREHACPSCPIRDACLEAGIESSEHGPFGGVTSNVRAKLGARPAAAYANLANVVHPKRGPRPDDVPHKKVRAWAREHGYEVPPKGRVPNDVVLAYLASAA